MEVRLECLYCGHKWLKTYWTRPTKGSERCSICNDSRLKIREVNPADKIDYYVGCPPFPEDTDPFEDAGGNSYD